VRAFLFCYLLSYYLSKLLKQKFWITFSLSLECSASIKVSKSGVSTMATRKLAAACQMSNAPPEPPSSYFKNGSPTLWEARGHEYLPRLSVGATPISKYRDAIMRPSLHPSLLVFA
jgi:hypothetical protein